MGFHNGELAVQRRAGVREEARRLAGMLDAPDLDLDGSMGRFLADRTFAAMTARDADGRLWISPLTGPRGFLDVVGAATLRVHSTPPPSDPLHDVTAGQPVGLLAIEFAKRRRVRVNGTLTGASQEGLTIKVDQAYGNCPQYIQQRVLVADASAAPVGPARHGCELSQTDIDLIRHADTALLGTTHPDRGADASHRGGPPGFVRVEDPHTLWWPDYPGNNMFNSFGNLAVDRSAAVTFVDFASGTTLHLSGTAELQWAATGAGDDGDTGRRVRFTVEAVVAGAAIPLRARQVAPSPYNPPLTDWRDQAGDGESSTPAR